MRKIHTETTVLDKSPSHRMERGAGRQSPDGGDALAVLRDRQRKKSYAGSRSKSRGWRLMVSE